MRCSVAVALAGLAGCLVGCLAGCNFHSNDASLDGGAHDAPSGTHDGSGGGSGVRGSRAMTVDLGNAVQLDNFTLEVALDGSIIDYAQAASTSGLRFLDANGGKLSYELEHWNPSGTSIAWVLVPVLAGGGATKLTLQWGDGLDPSAPGNVWGTNYQQVLHFDASGATTTDSAGVFYTPSESGVTSAAGAIGNGAAFAPGSTVTFAHGADLYSFWPDVTLQFWIEPDYATLSPAPVTVMDRGGPFSAGQLFDDGSGAGPEFSTTWLFQNGATSTLAVPVVLQQWNHVAFTFDGATLTAFSNGIQRQSASVDNVGSTHTQLDGTSSFHLGSAFTGALDELEVQSIASQSLAWFNAEIAATKPGAIVYQ